MVVNNLGQKWAEAGWSYSFTYEYLTEKHTVNGAAYFPTLNEAQRKGLSGACFEGWETGCSVRNRVLESLHNLKHDGTLYVYDSWLGHGESFPGSPEPGTLSRAEIFTDLLDKGYTPEQILRLAKGETGFDIKFLKDIGIDPT